VGVLTLPYLGVTIGQMFVKIQPKPQEMS
jgi:hypothetical protein